jgi:hypothetical protein
MKVAALCIAQERLMRQSGIWMAAVGAVYCAALLVPASALAQDGAKKDGFRLDIVGGLKGGLNGSWFTEIPEDSRVNIGGQEYIVDPDYYPSFGLGGTVGLALDIRAMGIVGLETGLHLSFDNAKGWNDLKVNGQVATRINQEQSTTSMRIPLLLKVGSPDGTVKPALGLGVEFVVQSDSTIEYSEEKRAGQLGAGELERLQARNQIEPSSYTLGVVSLGLEIDFGNLRMPIELRAAYNLGYDDGFAERVRVEGDNPNNAVFYYNGAYQGHFGLFLGLVYDYELWL